MIRFLLDSHTSDANMLEHGTPRVTRKYKCYCYSICLKNIHIILKCFVESNRLTTQRALIILSQRLFWFSPPHQHELLNPLCANPCEETMGPKPFFFRVCKCPCDTIDSIGSVWPFNTAAVLHRRYRQRPCLPPAETTCVLPV